MSFRAVAERFQVKGADGLPTVANGKIAGPLALAAPRWMRPPVIAVTFCQFAVMVEEVPASLTMITPRPVASGSVGGISLAPLIFARKSVPAFNRAPSANRVRPNRPAQSSGLALAEKEPDRLARRRSKWRLAAARRKSGKLRCEKDKDNGLSIGMKGSGSRVGETGPRVKE